MNGSIRLEKVDSVEVTAEDEWKYSFTNLPKYSAGNEIVYTVSEESVTGYETTINGYDITNTHVPETVTVEENNDNGNSKIQNTPNTNNEKQVNTNPVIPQTGDPFNYTLIVILLVVGVVGIIVLQILKKKNSLK